MIDPDDLAAFRAAVADARPLPPDDRVQLPVAKPRRLPTPKPPRDQAATSLPKKRRETELPTAWQKDDGPPPPALPADPDTAAFVVAMSGVEPLPAPNLAQLNTPPPPPRPQQFVADERAALRESLHGPISLQDRLEGGDEPTYLRPGLASGTLRDLRRGRWVVQDEIDLHGLNRDEARQLLAGFMAECLQYGKRCVRVVHGKGLGSPQKISILRQLVRGWLAQRDEVLAYCQARPQEGGEGALVVLLRAPKKFRAA